MALALTFDDGPSPWTAPLLDVLQSHQCSATFFLLGANIQHSGSDFDARQVVQRLLQEGHLAGNHSMSHNGKQSLLELRKEIETCDGLLRDLYTEAGVPCPQPIPFRLPFGIRTFVAETQVNGVRQPRAALDHRLQTLASIGRTHVHWTALLPDWEMRSEQDMKQLVEAALKHIADMGDQGLDAVLTMHDGAQPSLEGPQSREWTVRAVDEILTRTKKNGTSTFRIPQVGY